MAPIRLMVAIWCVCIGNVESHLPEQIFPGDWWSQCAVIMNMICCLYRTLLYKADLLYNKLV